MKYKIISGTCVLPSITFYLFIQISIGLPRNTETPCFPVVKLKQTFWETEVLLFFPCFLYSSVFSLCLPRQLQPEPVWTQPEPWELAAPGGVSWGRIQWLGGDTCVRWHSPLTPHCSVPGTHHPRAALVPKECALGFTSSAWFLELSIRQLSPSALNTASQSGYGGKNWECERQCFVVHRTVWVGKDFKDHLILTNLQCPRLLTALPNLALSTSSHGAGTASQF